MINVLAILSGQYRYQSECYHLGYQCIGFVVVNTFLLFVALDD